MTARDVVFIGVIITTIVLGSIMVHYSYNTISDSLLNNSEINTSNTAISDSIRKGSDIADRLDYIGLVFFLSLSFGIILTGYFIGGEAIYSFIYFIVIIIAVVVSAVLNNVWGAFSQTNIFVTANTLSSFPITTHLMNNLPFYIGAVGFLGLIVMFIKGGTTS